MEFLPFPCCLQLPRIVPHCTLIKQWGSCNLNQPCPIHVNYPISFPKGAFRIIGVDYKYFVNLGYAYVGQISSGFTTNGFLFEDRPNKDCRKSEININYIVIGH